jgi:hypothetical protein
MSEPQLFRHGDLVFSKQSTPHTAELKPAHDLVVAGNDTAPHTIVGACMFSREGEGANTVIRLRLPEDTRIIHAGRHTEGVLKAGDYTAASLAEGPGRNGVID